MRIVRNDVRWLIQGGPTFRTTWKSRGAFERLKNDNGHHNLTVSDYKRIATKFQKCKKKARNKFAKIVHIHIVNFYVIPDHRFEEVVSEKKNVLKFIDKCGKNNFVLH